MSDAQDLLVEAQTLAARGDFAAALARFNVGLVHTPDDVQAWIGRGVCLSMLQRPEEALGAFDAALQHAPAAAPAHHNRGKALYTLDRFDEARAAYARALELDPDYASAWNNIGVTLEALGRRDEAIEAYRRAIALRQTQAREAADPRLQNPQFNLGVALLRAGQYEEGFTLYEQRFAGGAARRAIAAEEAPLWDGKRLEGVLRVWSEQGPGDQIVFTRLLPLVLQRTPQVSLDVDPRLAPLLRRAYPGIDVRPANDPLRAPAAQIGLGSLPHVLGLNRVALPIAAPRLQADETRRGVVRARYEAMAAGRPIIGLAWASPQAPYAAQKSVALRDWRPLLERDAFFVSLQYGDPNAEIAAAGAPIHVDSAIDQLADLEAVAAQLAGVDAIFSVSSTLAHLAGAMGLSAHIILPHGQGLHWYWGLEREATPWYPSLRLVRRGADEPWHEAVARAVVALEKSI